MYVTSNTGNSILAIDGAGNVSTFANTTPSYAQVGPTGIALDAHGNVYVANGTGNSVVKYSGAGVLLATLATNGTGATNVKGPYGLRLTGATGSERLYVADAGNNRILVLSTAGAAIGSFGTAGSGNGQLSQPHGVAVSATGDVAVADFANNRLSIWH